MSGLMRELALWMLEWEEKMLDLQQLEKDISEAVLSLGKTQVVGGVRATYVNGRKKYDYETPGSTAPDEIIVRHSEEQQFTDWEAIALRLEPSPELIEEYTDREQVVDWKAVCAAAGIEPAVVSQGEPSVKISLPKE